MLAASVLSACASTGDADYSHFAASSDSEPFRDLSASENPSQWPLPEDVQAPGRTENQDPGSQDPTQPRTIDPDNPRDLPQTLDAVEYQEVLERGWERRDGGFRVRGAVGFGGTGFEASGSTIDGRSGDYFGGVGNFRSEILWAPGSNFEIGPRFLIGGRGTEFDNDSRLDYEALDVIGEIVGRVYFGDLREQTVRPYFEAFGGGGLQVGEIEFRENGLFTSTSRRIRETTGIFTFGGGTGIEWFAEESLFGTLGIEVRSVQTFDAPFFDPEVNQLDVALVLGFGTSL